MPNYIDDWPYLSIPNFTDLWKEMNSAYTLNSMGIRVRYTARKDFDLTIKKDGEIIIKCPADASLESIEEVIREEETWIRGVLESIIKSKFT